MARENLVYGDTVYFKDLAHEGMVTCKKRKVCMAVVEKLLGTDSPPSIKDCCFTILPKLGYSHSQRLAKHLKLHETAKEEDWPEKVQRQIQGLREKDKDEKLKNIALIQKMQGALVPCGTTVMLFHVQTDSFLTLMKESADVDKNALKLVVSPEGSKGAWFDILPGFKTGKVGDSVAWGASVSLRNTKNDVTLNVCESDSPIKPQPAHPYVEAVYEINCYVKAAVFSILPYRPPSAAGYSLVLNAGDIVTLYHADSDAYLVCDGDKQRCPN